MRRMTIRPHSIGAVAASGLVLGLLIVPASTAVAATPATSTLTVPSTAGETVSVTWTGTIPPLTNASSDCAPLADTPAVDQHLATVAVPEGIYGALQAQFTFRITWTPAVNLLTSDEILTVVGPGGVIGSSDGGTPSETVRRTNLIGGTYKVIACGFANAQPQDYTGTFTITTVGGGTPTSALWNHVNHKACCEGNSAAVGGNNFVLAPTLLTANSIYKSSDSGRNWKKVYPPVDVSFPFGIEGDLAAFGDDVVYFGTELGAAAVAFSRDAGETWTLVQTPVASAGNDQAWLFLGPMPDVCPVQLAPYVLTGWFRIGAIAAFSCDGGVTWPIQTPLVGVAGLGPEHVACLETAQAPAAAGDIRVPNQSFARMKGVRHGNWGTDRRFYWTQISDGNLYVCATSTFGATWEGVAHPLADGTAAPANPITAAAFDQNGTLYITQSNTLYVTFDQGRSMRFVHTLPRWGSNAADGAGQAIAVDGGTVHVALREDDGEVWYLRGDGADTASPVWREELVDTVVPADTRLDFIQIVLNAKGVPTIGYTDSLGDTATASRDLEPIAVDDFANTPQQVPVTVAVLANDSDPDGDTLAVQSAGEPANGTATVNPGGTITYSPALGFAGVDSFTYTISDGTASASATVEITVRRGRKR